jgi:hypothetical protein
MEDEQIKLISGDIFHRLTHISTKRIYIQNLTSRLSSSRASEYNTWLQCLCMLKNVEREYFNRPNTLRSIAHEFSKKCPEKYSKLETDEYYENHTKSEKRYYGIYHLEKWVMEDDYKYYYDIVSVDHQMNHQDAFDEIINGLNTITMIDGPNEQITTLITSLVNKSPNILIITNNINESTQITQHLTDNEIDVNNFRDMHLFGYTKESSVRVEYDIHRLGQPVRIVRTIPKGFGIMVVPFNSILDIGNRVYDIVIIKNMRQIMANYGSTVLPLVYDKIELFAMYVTEAKQVITFDNHISNGVYRYLQSIDEDKIVKKISLIQKIYQQSTKHARVYKHETTWLNKIVQALIDNKKFILLSTTITHVKDIAEYLQAYCHVYDRADLLDRLPKIFTSETIDLEETGFRSSSWVEEKNILTTHIINRLSNIGEYDQVFLYLNNSVITYSKVISMIDLVKQCPNIDIYFNLVDKQYPDINIDKYISDVTNVSLMRNEHNMAKYMITKRQKGDSMTCIYPIKICGLYTSYVENIYEIMTSINRFQPVIMYRICQLGYTPEFITIKDQINEQMKKTKKQIKDENERIKRQNIIESKIFTEYDYDQTSHKLKHGEYVSHEDSLSREQTIYKIGYNLYYNHKFELSDVKFIDKNIVMKYKKYKSIQNRYDDDNKVNEMIVKLLRILGWKFDDIFIQEQYKRLLNHRSRAFIKSKIVDIQCHLMDNTQLIHEWTRSNLTKLSNELDQLLKTINGILSRHGLKIHLFQTFEDSEDDWFILELEHNWYYLQDRRLKEYDELFFGKQFHDELIKLMSSDIILIGEFETKKCDIIQLINKYKPYTCNRKMRIRYLDETVNNRKLIPMINSILVQQNMKLIRKQCKKEGKTVIYAYEVIMRT